MLTYLCPPVLILGKRVLFTSPFHLIQIRVERIETTLKLNLGVDWPDVNFICQRQPGITLGQEC